MLACMPITKYNQIDVPFIIYLRYAVSFFRSLNASLVILCTRLDFHFKLEQMKAKAFSSQSSHKAVWFMCCILITSTRTHTTDTVYCARYKSLVFWFLCAMQLCCCCFVPSHSSFKCELHTENRSFTLEPRTLSHIFCSSMHTHVCARTKLCRRIHKYSRTKERV